MTWEPEIVTDACGRQYSVLTRRETLPCGREAVLSVDTRIVRVAGEGVLEREWRAHIGRDGA